MNKAMLQKLFLILLPVSAMGLAIAGDSVTVFDPNTGDAVLGSYFDLIPEAGNLQILPPLAGILAVVAVLLAVLYVVKGSAGYLRDILWVAALSATAAALPIALAEDVMVVPNVVLPILMGIQSGLAWYVDRKPNAHRITPRRKV